MKLFKGILIYAIALIFLVWLFFYSIPKDFLIQYPILCALAGVICIASLYLLMAILKSFIGPQPEVDKNTEVKHLKLLCYLFITPYIAVLLISFFGTTISLVSKGSKLKSIEFEENGIFTTGIVVSGKILKSRKGNLSKLTVKYNVDGQEYIEDTQMPASSVEEYAIGKEVPLEYSRRKTSLIQRFKFT